MSCVELEKIDTCSIHLFCPRYKSDNPYYSPNNRLHKLTGIIKTLTADFSGRLVRISGGHRAQLKNNCEALVEITLSTEMNLESVELLLENLLRDSLVSYRVMENLEREPADVE